MSTQVIENTTHAVASATPDDSAATRDALLADIERHKAELPSFDALFLSGSCARGLADDQSDLDFVGVVEPERASKAVAEWKALLGSIVPVVLWNERQQGAVLLNAVTSDWLRCDVSLVSQAMFGQQAKDLVRPLHDPLDLYAGLLETRRQTALDGRQLSRLVSEFIRVLGLLVVVDTRSEYIVGASGVGMLRDFCRELLLLDMPQAYRGGALHLNRLLGAEDLALLKGLPYPAPERDAVVAAHAGVAAFFLPRARALAAEHGVAWPAAFEDAAKRALARRFGDLFAAL